MEVLSDLPNKYMYYLFKFNFTIKIIIIISNNNNDIDNHNKPEHALFMRRLAKCLLSRYHDFAKTPFDCKILQVELSVLVGSL